MWKKNRKTGITITKKKNKNKETDEKSTNTNSTVKEKIEKINSPILNIGKNVKDSHPEFSTNLIWPPIIIILSSVTYIPYHSTFE